jgi:hypothetical protein
MSRTRALVWILVLAACRAELPVLVPGERSEIPHEGLPHDVHVSPPALAAGPGGELYLAWARSEADGNHLYVTRVGAASPAPVRVDPPDLVLDSIHQAPGLAIGSAGEVHVSWSSRRPRPPGSLFASDLRLSTSRDGGRSFGAALRINADQPASHAFEGIARTADGALLVAWLDDRDGPGRAGTFAARIAESGRRVEPEQRLGSSSCVCCRVDVASGEDGAAAVLWREELPGKVRDMHLAASRDAGRSFAQPALVHDDGWVLDACPHRGGRVAIDAGGRLVSAWYTEGRDERPALLLAASRDGRRFGAPLRLDSQDGSVPDQVGLALGPGGTALVVWETWTAARRRVMARVANPASDSLGPPQSLSSAVKAFAPSAVATPSGFAVAWHEEAFPVTRTVVQRFALQVSK